MISDAGRAYTQSCIAAYHAEKARLTGGTVTECRPVGGGMSCVTQ